MHFFSAFECQRKRKKKELNLSITDHEEPPSKNFNKDVNEEDIRISRNASESFSEDLEETFMEEPVYHADEFFVKSARLNRREEMINSEPPPSFKDGLAKIPEKLQDLFAKHLHGKLTGIYPLSLQNIWFRNEFETKND